ncbi:hypothetical protein [Acidithrix sp. C25]|uniref:hypothetical protein n=1 Tax=Acidithrix sp. C25 TaxID=1671482 RepID=UPI00191BB690|nr:hypothetical protein [Acidithrix sp. C25]
MPPRRGLEARAVVVVVPEAVVVPHASRMEPPAAKAATPPKPRRKLRRLTPFPIFHYQVYLDDRLT